MASLTRVIKDELKLVRTALPAAGSSANSAVIDLGIGPLVDDVHLSLLLPALPNLADGKSATGKIQDSEDGTTFADVAGLATLSVTGANGDGSAATSKIQRAPLHIRRYVRAVWTVEGSGGDNTALKGEFALTF